MKRLLLIAMLIPCASWAQTFVWTNAQGRLQFSASQADAINGAVGAVTTSAVAPVAEIILDYSGVATDWPLLTDHPATNEVPAGGMTYRLDGNPITWWIVRQSDVIATQLSAHDNQGNPIVRTINLITGEDEVINLRSIVTARNFNELNAASRKSTNAAIKARNAR